MKVISLPRSMTRAIGMLLFCVPLAAFESILVSRASWWQLPRQTIGICAGAAFAVVILLAFGLARARSWAWDLTALCATAWCLSTVYLGVRMSMPALGFLAVFMVFFFGLLLLRLRTELRRSYFDPGIRWYQGGPEPISFLKCAIAHPSANTELEFRVSRLDREGAFVFAKPGEKMDFVTSGLPQELVFRFRERQLRCKGVPMRYLKRSSSGAGFRFQDLSLDTKKQLGDFIENLRGEGYVE